MKKYIYFWEIYKKNCPVKYLVFSAGWFRRIDFMCSLVSWIWKVNVLLLILYDPGALRSYGCHVWCGGLYIIYIITDGLITNDTSKQALEFLLETYFIKNTWFRNTRVLYWHHWDHTVMVFIHILVVLYLVFISILHFLTVYIYIYQLICPHL